MKKETKTVVYDEEAVGYLRSLHVMVIQGTGDLEKEETLLFLMALL